MHMMIELEHPKTHQRATYEVFDVSANGIAHVAQCNGPAALHNLAHSLAKAKLPTHLYSYNIVNWYFKDAAEAA